MNFFRFLCIQKTAYMTTNSVKHFIIPVYMYTLHVNYLEYKKIKLTNK